MFQVDPNGLIVLIFLPEGKKSCEYVSGQYMMNSKNQIHGGESRESRFFGNNKLTLLN